MLGGEASNQVLQDSRAHPPSPPHLHPSWSSLFPKRDGVCRAPCAGVPLLAIPGTAALRALLIALERLFGLGSPLLPATLATNTEDWCCWDMLGQPQRSHLR